MAEPQKPVPASTIFQTACSIIQKGNMSNLILEMRKDDMMVVNGAAIRFRNRTRIELTAQARFLFGRQIMAPAEADSPARRIYFALQTAYIGEEHERQGGLEEARRLVEEFKAATTSAGASALLDAAMTSAAADKCYQALRLARRVVQHEDAVLGRVDNTGRPPPQVIGSGEERQYGSSGAAGGRAA